MTSLNFRLVVVLSLLTALWIASPAAAGEQVPFKGSLAGNVIITPDTPPFVVVAIDASGSASHLGGFTVSIPHRVNRDNRTAVGSYLFTAANGDTLTADFTGLPAPTATPGVLLIVEHATITGGTGRFENASGQFVCERLFDTIAGETTGSFAGEITSPGAGKH